MIPCYNEELTIERAKVDFRRELSNAEIIVFDNNSTDRTAELAVVAGATVIREPRQGQGYVVSAMLNKINARFLELTVLHRRAASTPEDERRS